MKKVLVTGGAGYIGSFIVRDLKENGFDPVILDNMSSGHEDAVKGFDLHKIDLVKEPEKLDKLFKENNFEGVIHMAAFIQMGESFENPLKYFDNNLNCAVNLFEMVKKHNVGNIVFSSSAGVYGNPKKLPITERAERNPLNPYGETKYMVERILKWMDKSYGIKSMSIRYFNAAGAALDGSIGEDHPNESHLIPCILKAAIEGAEFKLFGDDYDTPDGTCVRDYIHVLDLANAHTLALQRLLDGAKSDFYNAGVGKGYSNRQILNQIKDSTGLEVKVKQCPRRKGDADSLYASIDKIKKDFKWEPKYGLKEIIESSFKWHKNNPQGYKK